MKMTIPISPATDDRLRTLKQIGADYICHYDMSGLPKDFAALSAIADRYRSFGLEWKVSECGPAMDRIIMGKPGADQQIEEYKTIVRHLGRLGVEAICYTFMPQVTEDCMVVRTDYRAPARGGAETSRFRLSDVGPDTIVHNEEPISKEAMWQNLETFLREVLPVAEEAGVRLALHPDDPPMGPLCGLERIMGSFDAFERVAAISDSPANAVTFCVGCFAEMGADLEALLHRFGNRIAFVHIRNLSGTPTDFMETFVDDGDVNMFKVFRTLRETGFDGYIRSDHAPRLALDNAESPDGYAIQGHLFALGYMRGLDHATR